jgi:hypothetical protein
MALPTPFPRQLQALAPTVWFRSEPERNLVPSERRAPWAACGGARWVYCAGFDLPLGEAHQSLSGEVLRRTAKILAATSAATAG